MTFRARNNGNQSWSQSVVHLGTINPQDRSSNFSDSSWMNSSRVAMQDTTVDPGDIATFKFNLKAPQAPGSYTECFNLVADGVSWMLGPTLCYTIDVVTSQDPNSQFLSLQPGQSLNTGSYLMSPAAHSVLMLQNDGNLVLYNDSVPQWSSGTNGTDASRLIMQTDGNLVLYNATGKALWNSATNGNANARVTLQSDGNLVIYSSNDAPLWATATYHVPSYSGSVLHLLKGGTLLPMQSLQMADRTHVLMMQTDGNLVLYSGGTPIWASYTQGHPGAYAVMQADGNLVIYAPTRQPLWATYTNANPGSTIVLQNDGNVVIYNAAVKPVWQTQTYGR